MFRIPILFSFFILLFASCHKSDVNISYVAPFDYVNPLIGTDSSYDFSHGNTYPVIALPWGMNFWTPQTGEMGSGWIYTYNADKIRGIKQTHQPSPWINDYGQFSLMPITGNPVFDENERASNFSHVQEVCQPNYYKVYLSDYDIETEITPTERAAVLRITYPENKNAYFVIDAFNEGSSVTIQPEKNRVIGYTTKNSGGVPSNFRNYFIIEFDHPFSFISTVTDGEITENQLSSTCGHAGAVIGFKVLKDDLICARIASSFISEQQADINLKEVKDKSFDQIRKEGKDKWNEILGKVEIQDKNEDNIKTFYSCLYRSVLFPRTFYEYDSNGAPIHYSPYNGQIYPGYLFTDTGFWDTFRSLFPLLNLLYPSVNKKIQEGLVNAYKESGFLPEWASPGHRDCMIGNNSASVVSDAYLKGLTGYDIESLWNALVKATTNVHPQISSTGRYGNEFYNSLGYIPCDVGIRENVARTLEYAYNDWCIYKLGERLGKTVKELAPFAERAKNYKNVFDPEVNLMRGKDKSGKFQQDFDPFKWGDCFTEGNSWHYTWSVFHDPKGLINLMGGEKNFNAMLDSVFNLPPKYNADYYGGIIHEISEMVALDMGNYAHGNQPIQHMAYLYNYSGEPWKTQFWVKEIMNRLYSASPDGYCGDEDNGQTSAWFVFSALGFYPVCPGSNQYIIGSPLFDYAKLNLENGETVEIIAKNNSNSTPYIERMVINGVDWDKNFITHEQLLAGVKINWNLSDRANYQRGVSYEALPYSFSSEEASYN